MLFLYRTLYQVSQSITENVYITIKDITINIYYWEVVRILIDKIEEINILNEFNNNNKSIITLKYNIEQSKLLTLIAKDFLNYNCYFSLLCIDKANKYKVAIIVIYYIYLEE